MLQIPVAPGRGRALGGRAAARLLQGPLAPREREGAQAGQAPVAGRAHRQGFAAPEAAIVSLAGAVPGHTALLAPQAVFCHHRQQVGVVMLHRLQR